MNKPLVSILAIFLYCCASALALEVGGLGFVPCANYDSFGERLGGDSFLVPLFGLAGQYRMSVLERTLYVPIDAEIMAAFPPRSVAGAASSLSLTADAGLAARLGRYALSIEAKADSLSVQADGGFTTFATRPTIRLGAGLAYSVK